ncbi:hypothetical protein QBC32DRAFT_222043 [Pseudoneurospora amorphoporcata]|uniref:Uncharacterized protein n=1 Tax=Pseudoneurospora amorphoporcata TaxID=241081 RepID=A0AAN6SCZ9_9PEZI|nr:hypothetical protein QBC32DRAFT_222043 [Pseudoneurospora amorphoporcata]
MELLPGPSFDGARKTVSLAIVALYRPPSRFSSLLIRLHPPFLVRVPPTWLTHHRSLSSDRCIEVTNRAITRIRIYLLRLLCLSGGMRLLLGSEALKVVGFRPYQEPRNWEAGTMLAWLCLNVGSCLSSLNGQSPRPLFHAGGGSRLGNTNTNPHATYIKYVKHVSRRKDDNEYVSGANMPAKNHLRLSVHIVLPGYLVNSFTPSPVCALWKSWKTTSQFGHPAWARDGRSSAHARVLYHVVTDMSDDSYFTSQEGELGKERRRASVTVLRATKACTHPNSWSFTVHHTLPACKCAS